MYALVRIGGRQFQAKPGARLRVPRLGAEVGTEVEFEEVLLLSGEGDPTIGGPHVPGARVTVRVVEHGRDKKILVFHKKRRKDFRKLNGHRQPYSDVEVTAIQVP